MIARKFAAFVFVLVAFAGVLFGTQRRAAAGVLVDEDASALDGGVSNGVVDAQAPPPPTAVAAPDASVIQVVVIAPTPPPPAPTTTVPIMPGADMHADYTGVSVALRGGVSLPVGQAKTAGLSDVVGLVAPIGIDVGYYLRPNLYIGAYFIYGFATTSTSSQDACPPDQDSTCSAQQYRFGVNVEYAFRHHTAVSPWIRYGIGLDVVNLESSGSDSDTTSGNGDVDSEAASLFGLEWAILSAGIDFKPGYFYGIGPYVEAALGDYFTSGGFASPHAWITFGLRLRTGLFIP